ncbi:mechanosensitive ion channel family protein [Blastococcus brunescens]|uniref:Mechanosensitive ion channel domain-containing protein n=1 Tax=Blastococcus brunescens TaxID=1564165 RepID=A0ABZ1AZF1_9ACTN|nr:mechanosensitive ion channel domain-containing protein [Blastococcus sp. BMG 8361]WRL62813.1 mechanosensitive ion channel domain-containing protein [Blastococcus sp. BMG 8361]
MTVELFGQEIRLLFLSQENGIKLLLTLGLVLFLLLLRWAARFLARTVVRGVHHERARFWTRQAINLVAALLLFLGFLSIWFDDPTRLATGIGLVTAGLAFALQKVITALAGYVVILRGDTFNVGDRITMGGVRGDVIALGFIRTTIMEMGQPPAVQNADPAQWVRSRQYTGRVVTVTNDKVFDEAVYNYTRDFPTCGRKSPCRSVIRTTARGPRRSCWRRRDGTPSRPRTCRPRRWPRCVRSTSSAAPTSSRRCTGGSPTTGWSSRPAS